MNHLPGVYCLYKTPCAQAAVEHPITAHTAARSGFLPCCLRKENKKPEGMIMNVIHNAVFFFCLLLILKKGIVDIFNKRKHGE